MIEFLVTVFLMTMGLFIVVEIGVCMAGCWAASHVARLALALFRDRIVRAWPDHVDDTYRRWVVHIWAKILPGFLATAWLILTAITGVIISPLLSVPMALLSTIALLMHYYRIYTEEPPQHYKWAEFERCRQQMLFDRRLAQIMQRMSWRLKYFDILDWGRELLGMKTSLKK